MSIRPFSSAHRWTLLLLMSSLASLWGRAQFLEKPNSTVFDESYYIKYSLSYCCSREYYTDLHPPLPKLIYALPGFFSNYAGTFTFGQKVEPPPTFEGHGVPVRGMRLIAAVVGTLVPIFAFALVRALGGAHPVAFLAFAWTSLDNALLIHSSFVLLDQFLLLGILGTLLFYLKAQTAARLRHRIAFAATAGGFLALGLGTKFTAVCALIAVVADACLRAWRAREKRATIEQARILLWGAAAFSALYTGAWIVHESLLFATHYQMSGDAQFGAFIDRFVWNHWNILHGHFSIGSADHYGSRWWEWLRGHRPLLFWNDAGKTIYFFPNQVVWRGTVAFALFSMFLTCLPRISAVRLPALDPEQHLEFRLPLIMVAANFLPNLAITRVLYLYHFLPTLVGLIVLNALWLQRFAMIQSLRPARERRLFGALVVLPTVAMILTLPFSHGATGPYAEALKKTVDKMVNWR